MENLGPILERQHASMQVQTECTANNTFCLARQHILYSITHCLRKQRKMLKLQIQAEFKRAFSSHNDVIVASKFGPFAGQWVNEQFGPCSIGWEMCEQNSPR